MDELKSIAVALAVGLLIGIERGWRDRAFAEGERVAGIRTFALSALLGALWGLLAEELDPLLLGFGFIAFTTLVIIAHVLDVRRNQDYGITTSVAALVTFAIGAIAARGELTLAAAVGVLTAILLSLKPLLHRWLATLQEHELFATFKLLLISVVLLPVLPDQGYGPWHSLNPYEIWWFIVIIATLSFVGYFAIKFAGARRGIVFTGLFGGFASSTAIALTFSRMQRTNPTARTLLAAGIVVAGGTMFPRMLLEVAVVNTTLLPQLVLPFSTMAIVCFASIPLLLRHVSRDPVENNISLRNPFELLPALKFGLLLIAVVIAEHGVQRWLGAEGLYLLSALAGMVDVDAITLTMARQSSDSVEPEIAAQAIFIAAMVNTFVKGGIALFVARSMAWPVAAIFAAAMAAGALAFILA